MTSRNDPHWPIAVAAEGSLNDWKANVYRTDLERPIQCRRTSRIVWIGIFIQRGLTM